LNFTSKLKSQPLVIKTINIATNLTVKLCFLLYRYPNVIILTTSNVTGAIDLAFVDRADIKQYIGPPSAAAIYSIFRSCIEELMKVRTVLSRKFKYVIALCKKT